MTHYDTLQVVPWADEPVIRAAYRALMRLYHPDTNQDPEAQLRAREITAAFAVLSNPGKRAAYDAFPTLDGETDTQGGRLWSIRNAGTVSVGVAVIVLSLTIAMWPQSGVRPTQQDSDKMVGIPKVARVRASVLSLPARSSVSNVPEHLAPTPRVVAGASNGAAITMPKRSIVTVNSKPTPVVRVPKPIAAEALIPRAANAPQSSTATARSATVASCGRDSTKIGPSECTDDRQAQVERIAAIFFKQSMDHADSHKQQLLLSARTRSAYSRTLCRSSECVTQSFLQQMRDTTEIMQGQIPTAH